jgi:2-polyprenyl-3-methyl-5-hydroxy-6-metoxy-1,4-benzoquinol methylase
VRGFKGFDSVSALQGYYQSLLLLHFTRSGVFERLRKRLTAEDLAREFKWQLAPLRSCLDFLAATTGVIGRDRKGYTAVLSPEQLNGLAFQIEKFAGAYGRTALKLPDLLAGKTLGSSLVDQQSLARAFSATKDASTGLVAAMILGARPATLLDLGCGTGSLLVQLAKVDPEFHGVGVDASKPMCKVARKQAARNRVRSRVRFVCPISEGHGHALKATRPARATLLLFRV